MALTPEQIRARDAQRRADARPPDAQPPGGAPTAWWRGAFETRDDLPLGGNVRGDVALVMDDDEVSGALTRWWDGAEWQPLAGGAGGVRPIADYIVLDEVNLAGRVDGDWLIWDEDAAKYVTGAVT